MTFASDKLYKGYLRRYMPTIVSTVKVAQIIPHLPCLTDHDRENIQAKRETYGNYDSMVLLLDCLKRRENWPEEFITALENCGHRTMAAEIANEYNNLKGNSNAGSPSATVARAHVHPAPSASHVSIPATPLPVETSTPPQAAQASPPLQVPQQPQPSETSSVPDSPPLEVLPGPSTHPPSPETQHTRAASRNPPAQREIISNQEPVENSETDDSAVISEHLSIVDAPQPSSLVEQSETDTQSEGEDLQTTKPTAEVRPPTAPHATQVNSNMTYEATVSVKTPEKAPVQDSTPPILQEKKTPACTQDVDSSFQPEFAAAPLPGAAPMDYSLNDNNLCLSQPGDLISVQPQPPDGPNLPTPNLPMEPYSGNTTRLEISSVAENLAQDPGCCVTSTTVTTSSMLPCQEDGIVVSHNEPEENHYDSANESLQMQEILENLVQICEEPSILNLDGHDPTPQGQLVNGEAAKETIFGASTVAETVNTTPANENYQPSGPAPVEGSPPALQDAEKKTSSGFLTSHPKYFVTAAGVGACLLLLVWKFKN